MGKRKKRKFKLKIGSGQSKGFCETSNIRSVVRRRAAAIRACYEKQLQVKPNLKGKVVARWTINTMGKVANAHIKKSSMKSKAVESCLLQRIRIMRFKKPESGVCVVQWPFVFTAGSN